MKKTKNVKIIICIVVLVVLALSGLFLMKNKSYKVRNSEWTMLVYMCGSDLEDRSGLCSKNINDMLLGAPDNNLQIAIETGGTYTWHRDEIENKMSDKPKDEKLERFIVSGDKLVKLDEPEVAPMVHKDTLKSFIKWGMENAPAEHYMLVLWDHGSGSAIGYGRDMLYRKEPAMCITDIADAISESEINLDIIGFDACLMGGIETAVALSSCADYMISSEETEPGDGWNYKVITDYLDNAENATAQSIAEVVINEYTKVGDTLALIKLDKAEAVRDSIYEYMQIPRNFEDESKIRSDTESFGKDMFDLIDINDYVEKSFMIVGEDNLTGHAIECARKVQAAINEAVLINGTRRENCCGLSFYYPYKFPDNYEERATYFSDENIWNTKTRAYFDSFMDVLKAGKEMEYDLTGDLTEIDDEYAIILTHDEFNLISSIQLTTFLYENGENLLQGRDFYFDHTVEGDDKDYLWYFNNNHQLYFEDSRVAFFASEYIERDDGTFELRGNIPAKLNGKTNILVNIRFDNDNKEDALILGYTITDNLDKGISSRDYLEFQKGDKIEFLFDYYDSNMNYVKTDTLAGNENYEFKGDFMKNQPEIAYYTAEAEDRVICYTITDIYLNKYLTEGILFKKDSRIQVEKKLNTFE